MPVSLVDLSVFVVEDEALVALNLEDMLADLGCRVAATAMRPEQVEAALARGLCFDVAILDVNLGGQVIFPFAERVKESGVPLVFATGYGMEGLPPEWRGYPVLQKPYTAEQVAEALAEAVGDRQDA